MTNAHVVEGASSVQVKVGDGEAKTARVVGEDTSADLALLKIDPGSQTLHALHPRRLRQPFTWATPPTRSAARTASSAR